MIRSSLVELAEDPDVDVRFYASQALQSIDGVMMSSYRYLSVGGSIPEICCQILSGRLGLRRHTRKQLREDRK